jgi:transglutaminase-like putative cysteine protease
MPRASARARGLTRAVEDSTLLRAVVLAITMLSVGAVAAVGGVDAPTAVGSLVLVPLGSWLAYRRRRASNTGLKVILAAGLLAALAAFLLRVQQARSVDEARATLGSLFVWVQVLHSFDLPRRRDLAFSVVASTALMAEAGSLSLDAGFGLLLVPYAALVAVWLYLSDRARGMEDSGPVRLDRRTASAARAAVVGPARILAASLAVVLAASAAVFLATPRLPGTRVVAPPFSLVRRVAVPGFSGAVVNPDLPVQAGTGGQGPVRGVGYPGFGSEVDLRIRGILSDRLIMRVRSPQAAFWRAQAYDTFDGTTWTAPDLEIAEVGRGFGEVIDIPSREPSFHPSRTLVQTFFIVRRQPNIVFAAFQPREVYFPAARLAVDRFASVRSPIILEPETIYSVVSEVPAATPALLRDSPAPSEDPALERYTQLPVDLPDRVTALAHRITDSEPTTYDKVMAVQRWLETHTRYRVDIPPDPPGVDAVDYFLFERREGYCEHIASTMAILLRAVGIPTRFAVGFDAGAHNLLTGYYEVRESDAHSWVEVYYPGRGWVSYDPTHAVPAAEPGVSGLFVASEFLSAIGRFVARVVPGPIKAAARAVASAAGAAVRGVAAGWPVAAGCVLLAGAAWLVVRRRRSRRRLPPPVGAAAAFASLCRTFERRGHPRPVHRTPSEHLEALVASEPLARERRADVELIVRTFERERFAPRPPPEEEVAESLAAAARLQDRAR